MSLNNYDHSLFNGWFVVKELLWEKTINNSEGKEMRVLRLKVYGVLLIGINYLI